MQVLRFFCVSVYIKILSQISQLPWEPVFKFCIHIESECPSIMWDRKGNQDAEIYFVFFSHFPSITPVQYIGKFVSKISQELLPLEYLNLVQMLRITSCIV